MLKGWVIVTIAFVYLGILFAIAYYGDKRAEAGRSIIANPYVYALSLAVFVTAWTFYGSVGRAAEIGVGFLPIYIGPTLMAALWGLILRKIIRICKTNRITTLADFIASRYGKSALLGGLVTIIAMIGIVPYIALQLKAISNSFAIPEFNNMELVKSGHAAFYLPSLTLRLSNVSVFGDPAFYIALILAAFTIVFGTRDLDATERHEGMVAAIAFESLVKLTAFLAVGIFVTFGIFDGFGELFALAAEINQTRDLFTLGGGAAGYANWTALSVLSMLAVMFLPRQFQVAVVENVDEHHLNKAIWLLPLYVLVINIFVLPIAFGGLLYFSDVHVDPDTFVLTLPMAENREALALLVLIGGLSAATGMIIVETIALSTMACNDLVMPLLLRIKMLRLNERKDLSGLLLGIRRLAIVGGLLVGYAYYRIVGEAYALVSIGLISFAAVAQFAPAILGGIYWKGGTRLGALAGLSSGFLIWIYTLLLPSFAKSGWLAASFLEQGPFGIALLKPLELFGLTGLDPITHGALWSLLVNVAAYVGVSLLGQPSAMEQSQATLFVDVFKQSGEAAELGAWRGTASVPDLHALLGRFLGPGRADEAYSAYAKRRGLSWPEDELEANPELVHFVETQLAGAIGAASARTMVALVVQEEPLHDTLTGLPNRALLMDRLRDALNQAKQDNDYSYAVLLLNLDRFKIIIDSLGHRIGNQLLIGIAQRLEAGLRSGDTVASLGGNEFAILLEGIKDAGSAAQFANELQQKLSAPFNMGNHEVFTTATIGIALSKPGYQYPDEILHDAETANHRAMTLGKATCEIFESDMRTRAVALLEMETRLRRAIKGQDFIIHYQPLVSLTTGKLAGFESLVRMRSPDGSLVPPAEFIPLTEETGLINPIGRWVLRESCRQMRAWQEQFPDHPPMKISVNLAGRQFAQPDLIGQIEQALQETGLDAHSLKLEVTETLLMENADSATAVLTKLRAMNIQLLLDDFGTGYSSLSYLHRFPIDTVKIDASFVRNMDVDPKNAEIIQTIVILAHTLGMDLIAEGVETKQHVALLRALKVEYGQGYFFSRPLGSEAAGALIAAQKQW